MGNVNKESGWMEKHVILSDLFPSFPKEYDRIRNWPPCFFCRWCATLGLISQWPPGYTTSLPQQHQLRSEWAGAEVLPLTEEVKYLGILVMIDGNVGHDVEMGTVSAVMWVVWDQHEAKCQLTYVAILTCGHGCWAVFAIKVANIRFLWSMAMLLRQDEELRHPEGSQCRVAAGDLGIGSWGLLVPPFGWLSRMPNWEKPNGRPRSCWRDNISDQAW